MAKLERIYNVPLRKGFKKAVRYKKAKKAVKTLKEFLAKHMKVDIKNVKIGPIVNEKIWERGIRKPPHHVKVTAVKEDDVVKVELFGFKYEEPIKPGETEEEKEKKEKKTEEKDVKELEKELDKVVEKKPVKKKPAKKKTVAKKVTKKAKPKPKKTVKKTTKKTPSKAKKKTSKKK